MSGPEGFEYRSRKTGEVAIFQHGKLSVMLRDNDAKKFLEEVEKGDPQAVMAETAGNHKQGGTPGVGSQGPGSHMHGDAKGHPVKEFRRKTG
jgi:hypothetical protein